MASKISTIIQTISASIPSASFYLDILLPIATNPSGQDAGVDSATAFWLLSIFLQHSPQKAISLNILNKVLDALKSPAMTRKMAEGSMLVTDACAIFFY